MVDLFRHGWTVERSHTYGRNYFYNWWTKEKQWELPVITAENSDSPKNDEVNHIINTTDCNSGEEMDWEYLIDTSEWDIEEEEQDWNALIETEEWDINSQLCEVDEMIAQGGCKLSEELDKFVGQIITENFPISDEQLVKLPVVQEFFPLVNELER